MKAITLLNPHAHLLIIGAKKWETRGFKPGSANLRAIERDGLYIHAAVSQKWADLNGKQPFSGYLSQIGKMAYGAIIGHCRIGRIIRTADWLKEFDIREDSRAKEEWFFGDYSPGRWAWEVLEPVRFPAPIKYRGALSIWTVPGKIIPKTGDIFSE